MTLQVTPSGMVAGRPKPSIWRVAGYVAAGFWVEVLSTTEWDVEDARLSTASNRIAAQLRRNESAQWATARTICDVRCDVMAPLRSVRLRTLSATAEASATRISLLRAPISAANPEAAKLRSS